MSEVTQTQTSETPVNQNRPSGPRGNRREGGKPGSPRRGDRRDFKEVEKEFKEELLEIARVTRVTAGGRQLRFRAAVVIGNGKGTVWLGTGKANEVSVAVEKAVRDAKKNLINFPIVDGTLPHEVTANFKATTVLIHPAVQGTGIIAGGSIRKLAFVSGLQDVIIKRRGGTNALTNVQATLKALASLKKTGSEFLKPRVVAEVADNSKSVEKKSNRKN